MIPPIVSKRASSPPVIPAKAGLQDQGRNGRPGPPPSRGATITRSADRRIGKLGRQHFEQVAVGIAEIEAAAAMAVIDLHVFGRARAAAIGDALGEDAVEDPVKLRFADLEGIVVPLKRVPIVEIDGQRVVDADGREMRDWALVFETEDAREESGGYFLV